MFILKCISTLEGYEIEELTQEIEPFVVDELSAGIGAAGEVMRDSYGSCTLDGVIAAEYREQLPRELGSKVASDIPDFDDPDFFVKLHTDCAPVEERKRLFVRLWNAFEMADKRAFLSKVDPSGAFQRLAS